MHVQPVGLRPTRSQLLFTALEQQRVDGRIVARRLDCALARNGGRSDGNGRKISRSLARRSTGTAYVSLCTHALTSAHQFRAAVLAAARSGQPPSGSAGIIRSVCAYPARCSTMPLAQRPCSSRSGQDGELVAQQQILEHEVLAWAHPGQDGREQQPEQFKHALSIADLRAREDLLPHNLSAVDRSALRSVFRDLVLLARAPTESLQRVIPPLPTSTRSRRRVW
jgi:hypothetical protein